VNVWFRKKKQANNPAEGLRRQALSFTAAVIGISPGIGHQQVWGILMEIGFPEAVATLVCFADGTTSLYYSHGGGVIGAGEHAPVRDAAIAFVAMADALHESFAPALDQGLPQLGRVRFFAHTFAGLRSAEASEDDLGNNRHSLSVLFHSGHAVISAIRATGKAG
jgi:hypothetical protein